MSTSSTSSSKIFIIPQNWYALIISQKGKQQGIISSSRLTVIGIVTRRKTMLISGMINIDNCAKKLAVVPPMVGRYIDMKFKNMNIMMLAEVKLQYCVRDARPENIKIFLQPSFQFS